MAIIKIKEIQINTINGYAATINGIDATDPSRCNCGNSHNTSSGLIELKGEIMQLSEPRTAEEIIYGYAEHTITDIHLMYKNQCVINHTQGCLESIIYEREYAVKIFY